MTASRTDTPAALWPVRTTSSCAPVAPDTRKSRIRVPLLAINSADDQVNPPELGIIERPITHVPTGRFLMIPIGPTTRGHGTHTAAAVWKEPFAKFLDSLPSLPAPH